MRFLSGLLLGAILGVGGTVYFLSAGGGDYVIATSPRVQRLEADLRRVTSEREQGIKKLEEATQLIDQMAIKFAELERRFQALESAGTHTAPERGQDEPAASITPTPESEASQKPTQDEAAEKAAPESPPTESVEDGQGGIKEDNQPSQPEEHPQGPQAETPTPSSQETAPTGSTEAQPGEASESSSQEAFPEIPKSEQDESIESPS